MATQLSSQPEKFRTSSANIQKAETWCGDQYLADGINIKTLHQSYEALLHAHRDSLARKNVWTKQRLLEIIKLDLDKLTHALLEVKARQASVVLHTFFAGQNPLLPPMTGCLQEDAIDHLGFEIHEPLDLVLQGMDHWIAKTRCALRCELQIRKVVRFPASAAFQQRVGATTEIMRIWIQVEGRTLMLELFDIQRPVDGFLADGAPRLTHRNFDCLVTRREIAAEDTRRAARLFSRDAIWHYAFLVRSTDDVMQLHTDLQALAARDITYLLPYATPVQNRGDGSFHTKIINRQLAQELEFVAHDSAELRMIDEALP